MRHHNTLLHGLLQFIPWRRFDALVDEHGSDWRVRRLSSRSQLIALIHAQLSGASSLREIEATLASQQARLYHLGAVAPKRSTLADANAERSADVFCGLFEALLAQAHPGLRKASREAVRLIDATSISLTAHAHRWAGYSRRGCGAKVHVVLDPDAALPVHFVVTSKRVNDITPAKAMPIEAGATYVFDLGYYDFSWWAALDAEDCRFVTRLKTHTRPTLIEERQVETGGSIIADRTIRLADRLARNRYNPLDGRCARSMSGSTPAKCCASATTSRPRRARSPISTSADGTSSCSSAGSSRPSKSAAVSVLPSTPSGHR